MDHTKPHSNSQYATLGGGCFWCLDAIFRQVSGIINIESGFAGGEEADPSYEKVCSGKTDHIEVVQIHYDPAILSYHYLLSLFFAAHDPTQIDGQGHDLGPQYRSVIFYHDPSQQQIAQQLIDTMDQQGLFSKKIVTQVRPIMPFYPATPSHQNYYQINSNAPYCQVVIKPKLTKIRQLFNL